MTFLPTQHCKRNYRIQQGKRVVFPVILTSALLAAVTTQIFAQYVSPAQGQYQPQQYQQPAAQPQQYTPSTQPQQPGVQPYVNQPAIQQPVQQPLMPQQQYVGQQAQVQPQNQGQVQGQLQGQLQGQVQPGYVAAPTQQAYASPGIAPTQPTLTGAAAKNPNHPLVPIIEWAKGERPRVQAIKDYTFTLIKQESVNGKVYDPCMFDMKIRNEPFSVYLKYRQPEKKAGTEAIFVKGQNSDKIKAKGVGALALIGTTSLAPTGKFAMDGNKYPITEVGVARLVDLFIEVGENDILNNYECTVQYYENVPLMQGSTRVCTCIEVVHPKVTPGKFPFHIARIFIDDELQLPVRYESYDWPKKEGEKPTLLEAYIYHDLKLNVGLTDLDFDTKNPDYRF